MPLNHKLIAPTQLDGAVMRHHLLRPALDTRSYRVVFIHAPAGHGKTTLLQQMAAAAAQQGCATGWITLDESDDDPARFLDQFCQLVASAQMNPVRERVHLPFALTDDGGSGLVEEMLGVLGEAGRDVRLFIDDFHVIQSKIILSFVARLLGRLPEHVTLSFGSRRLPEIGLGRLQLRNAALLFKTNDMRFTRSEAEDFLSDSLDPQREKSLVDDLYSRTEGWPAALHLTRLALRGGSGRRVVDLLGFSTEPEFEEYLATDVLSAQPPAIRRFLLDTSVLQRLTPELCAFLTGEQNAETLIRELERSGLFIRPLGADRQWFRYHSLFSSFLLKQLRLDDADAPARLHQRAAEWFFAEGHTEEAMHHAVSSGDYARSASILETWSAQLVREGRLATIKRWLEALPLEHVRAHHGLQVKVLWALLFLRRFHEASPLLDALSVGLEHSTSLRAQATTLPLLVSVRHLMEDDIARAGEAVVDIDVDREAGDPFESFELGAIANIQSLHLRTQGEFLAAQDKAVIGVARSEAGQAEFSGAYAWAFLGNTYLAQARAQEALRAYRHGLDNVSKLRSSYASAVLTACYGEALYLTDNLEQARTLLEDSLPLVRDVCMPDAFAVAHITLAKLLCLDNRGIDAEWVLREGESVASASGLGRVVRLLNWERVREFLGRDEVEDARELADRLLAQKADDGDPLVRHAEEFDGPQIGEIRLLLHEGRTADALARIAVLSTRPQFSRRPLRQMRLRMLEAVAAGQSGDAERADLLATSVMERALPEHLFRFIAEETAFLAILERRLVTPANRANARLTKLEALYRQIVAHTAPLRETPGNEPSLAINALTERELEVLRMLGAGASNKEIGARLFVSDNTVKYHLRNIFSKLGIKNRTEASILALRCGLTG